MRTVRLLSTVAAMLAVAAVASAAPTGVASSPTGLKPFLLRTTEPAVHEFPRTPSFSWRPVRGAYRYDFQLAKNPNFSDDSVFWRKIDVRSPAVVIPLQLPWMTGSPYAVWARVRAFTNKGFSAWSRPFGFNVRWPDVPRQLPGSPGLSRWTPVEGATSYEVWFTKIGAGGGWTKKVAMRTTAVDHRESYTFHDGAAWSSDVRWRVRAVRVVPRESRIQNNGIPAVSYGPWSPEFVSRNPVLSGNVRTVAAVTAGATSRVGSAAPHEITPAFAFTGREPMQVGVDGAPYSLHRVYVFSDSDCVNVIFKGAITGSPAYAPRTTGPLELPKTVDDLAKAQGKILVNGPEGSTFMADMTPVKSTEESSVQAQKEAAKKDSAKEEDPAIDKPGEDPTITGADPTGATVDLPESGWPTGRYFWTVVPVRVYVDEDKKVSYIDGRQPQDTCRAGSIIAFGKRAEPLVAGQGTPFASGLNPSGRLVAARSSSSVFYGRPVVAWEPVAGAVTYQVQWSAKKYPWRGAGGLVTTGTAAELKLQPGSWWYRIRAINPYLPGRVKAMSWSAPLHLTVAKPRFAVAR